MCAKYLTLPIFIGVAGILAVPSLLAKSPKVKEVIEKIKPFQGYIGIALVVWGIVDLILMFVHLKYYFSPAFYGIVQIIAVFIEIILGFLLSANLLKTIKKIPQKTIDDIADKITPYQGWAGVIAVFIGVLRFIMYLIRGIA